MDGQTTLSFFQLMLLALGPATLAAAVAIVTPLVMEDRKQKADRKQRNGEKLEELVTAVYDLGVWLDTKRNANALGLGNAELADPIGKIIGLTDIYFPQFSDLANKVVLTARKFVIWTSEAGQRRLQGVPDATQGHLEAYNPFLAASKQFTEALTSYGHHEFTK